MDLSSLITGAALLAAGKAASSLAAGAYFLFDENVFAYLLNFIVDGGLVVIALACSKMIRALSCVRSGVIVPAPMRNSCARPEIAARELLSSCATSVRRCARPRSRSVIW